MRAGLFVPGTSIVAQGPVGRACFGFPVPVPGWNSSCGQADWCRPGGGEVVVACAAAAVGALVVACSALFLLPDTVSRRAVVFGLVCARIWVRWPGGGGA